MVDGYGAICLKYDNIGTNDIRLNGYPFGQGELDNTLMNLI